MVPQVLATSWLNRCKGCHLWSSQVTWLWQRILTFCFYLHFKPSANFLEMGYSISHYPALYKSNWRHWIFAGWHIVLAKPSISDQTSAGAWTFPPPGLLLDPLSSALAVFHPWGFVPLLRFRSLKIKHENHRVGEWGGAAAQQEAREQTDKWVWGCHSRLRSHALLLFFSLRSSYFSVHPLWRQSWTSVCLECGNEEGQTSELTENCQKSLYCVKSHKVYIQYKNIKPSYLFFHNPVIIQIDCIGLRMPENLLEM